MNNNIMNVILTIFLPPTGLDLVAQSRNYDELLDKQRVIINLKMKRGSFLRLVFFLSLQFSFLHRISVFISPHLL